MGSIGFKIFLWSVSLFNVRGLVAQNPQPSIQNQKPANVCASQIALLALLEDHDTASKTMSGERVEFDNHRLPMNALYESILKLPSYIEHPTLVIFKIILGKRTPTNSQALVAIVNDLISRATRTEIYDANQYLLDLRAKLERRHQNTSWMDEIEMTILKRAASFGMTSLTNHIKALGRDEKLLFSEDGKSILLLQTANEALQSPRVDPELAKALLEIRLGSVSKRRATWEQRVYALLHQRDRLDSLLNQHSLSSQHKSMLKDRVDKLPLLDIEAFQNIREEISSRINIARNIDEATYELFIELAQELDILELDRETLLPVFVNSDAAARMISLPRLDLTPRLPESERVDSLEAYDRIILLGLNVSQRIQDFRSISHSRESEDYLNSRAEKLFDELLHYTAEASAWSDANSAGKLHDGVRMLSAQVRQRLTAFNGALKEHQKKGVQGLSLFRNRLNNHPTMRAILRNDFESFLLEMQIREPEPQLPFPRSHREGAD